MACVRCRNANPARTPQAKILNESIKQCCSKEERAASSGSHTLFQQGRDRTNVKVDRIISAVSSADNRAADSAPGSSKWGKHRVA